MGEARRRQLSGAAHRNDFIARHPWCCFCGGSVSAVTIDHVPARAIFALRHWPESYEFPACHLCNQATRSDEEFISLLSRVFPDPVTQTEQEKVRQLIRQLHLNRSDLAQEMRMSAPEIEAAVSKGKLQVPPGFINSNLPVFSTKGPLVTSAVREFSRKLALALFYKHTKTIVPQQGGMWIRWYTNLNVMNGAIPEDLAAVVSQMPALTRNAKDLSDQFFYRWGVAETNDLAAFLAFFRKSFAVLAFVARSTSLLSPIPETDILRPFPAEHTKAV